MVICSGMFFARKVSCIAEVSSVSPSPEQTGELWACLSPVGYGV